MSVKTLPVEENEKKSWQRFFHSEVHPKKRKNLSQRKKKEKILKKIFPQWSL